MVEPSPDKLMVFERRAEDVLAVLLVELEEATERGTDGLALADHERRLEYRDGLSEVLGAVLADDRGRLACLARTGERAKTEVGHGECVK
jgi:hypothetical protein